MNPDMEDYSYSAIISYENAPKEQPTIIHVTGRGICPTVKVSQSVIQYGDCSVNSHKDVAITVTNRNPDIPIKIEAAKIPYFSFNPGTISILPKSSQTLIATFRPKGSFKRYFFSSNKSLSLKAVGSFQKIMTVSLMN